MAATSVNIVRAPSVHRAAVDAEFGGTLAAMQVKVSGLEHFARDGYVLVCSQMQGHEAPIREAAATDVAATWQAFGNEQCNYVLVGEKTLAPAGIVTAATWSRPLSPVRRGSFYADLRALTSEFWWSGDRPSVAVAIKMHDRRLEASYDRLARIERGEWDSQLGRRPSKTALTNAKAVLGQLIGGPIVPKKVVGGDGLIALYFTTGPKYSIIEILNNGAMLILNSEEQGVPQVERFTPAKLPSVIDRIRAHIA